MSFDAWVVAFGISAALRDVKIVEGPKAFLFLAAVVLIDACLLYRFFSRSAGKTAAIPPAGTAAQGPERC
jgi:hypothetical protein